MLWQAVHAVNALIQYCGSRKARVKVKQHAHSLNMTMKGDLRQLQQLLDTCQMPVERTCIYVLFSLGFNFPSANGDQFCAGASDKHDQQVACLHDLRWTDLHGRLVSEPLQLLGRGHD